MRRYLLKDKFARHTGYNEVGELNNIIIIYPQATAIIDNPLGCWDWWGYTVKFYGKQRILNYTYCLFLLFYLHYLCEYFLKIYFLISSPDIRFVFL